MGKLSKAVLGILFTLSLSLLSVARGQTFDLVINNGWIMDPESGLDAVRHLGVHAGVS